MHHQPISVSVDLKTPSFMVLVVWRKVGIDNLICYVLVNFGIFLYMYWTSAFPCSIKFEMIIYVNKVDVFGQNPNVFAFFGYS